MGYWTVGAVVLVMEPPGRIPQSAQIGEFSSWASL